MSGVRVRSVNTKSICKIQNLKEQFIQKLLSLTLMSFQTCSLLVTYTIIQNIIRSEM